MHHKELIIWLSFITLDGRLPLPNLIFACQNVCAWFAMLLHMPLYIHVRGFVHSLSQSSASHAMTQEETESSSVVKGVGVPSDHLDSSPLRGMIIWTERNAWLFNNEDPSLDKCKATFKREFALVIHRTKKNCVNGMKVWLQNRQVAHSWSGKGHRLWSSTLHTRVWILVTALRLAPNFSRWEIIFSLQNLA
jgi:hypothetical protein